MAPHSSTLAWKIPWMEEPGRLQSMGSLRVRLDWATSLSLFTFMHWRRKWQPTPGFLAWRIPGTGEPGGLPPMGLHRVGHDWSDLAAAEAEGILKNKIYAINLYMKKCFFFAFLIVAFSFFIAVYFDNRPALPCNGTWRKQTPKCSVAALLALLL